MPTTDLKPRVCRRLFDDEPRQQQPEVDRLIAQENREANLKFRERYNFDLLTETPLEGNYLWSKRRSVDGKWEEIPIGQSQLAADGDAAAHQGAAAAPGDLGAAAVPGDPAPYGGSSPEE